MATMQPNTGLLSPAPSEVSVTHIPDTLPTPRSHPLPSGSSKEVALIHYIDDRILRITRRYAKSFAAEATDRDTESGYTTFDQVVADINPVLDVVWISATPSIRVPYLLALAGHFRGFMHSFAFVTASFALAHRFDLAFLQLLSQSASGETVVSDISTTDRVRIRSLAQETRFEMIEVASKSGYGVAQEAISDDDRTDMEDDMADDDEESGDQASALSLGKVYERTLEILGADLSSLPPPHRVKPLLPPHFEEDVEIIDL